MNGATSFRYETAHGALHFSQDSDFWLTSMEGASSERVTLETIRLEVGASVSGQTIEARDITLNGVIFGNIEQNRKAIIHVVRPSVAARLYVMQNGVEYYIEGFPTTTPIFEDGEGMQEFLFSFTCAYPHWRQGEQEGNPFKTVQKLFSFPFDNTGEWYISTFLESEYQNLRNEGNVPCGFTAAFHILSDVTGNEATIALHNQTTGEMLKFYVPSELVHKGDTLEFSTREDNKGFWNRTTGGSMNPALITVAAYGMELVPADNRLFFEPKGVEAECTVHAVRGVLSGV